MKLDLNSGLERPTHCHILIVHQPDSEPSESGEKHTKQTKTNLRHNRADFRIENQKRKKRESQELDENSKSTLECFSSWCQVTQRVAQL